MNNKNSISNNIHQMERSKAKTMSCKKHPKNRQSPGVCSFCLRDRLSNLSSSSRSSVSSSPSTSCSSLSSNSSSYESSNVSSCSSPIHYKRHTESKGYISSFLNIGLNESRSIALADLPMCKVEVKDQWKTKGGFWSKLLCSTSKRMDGVLVHSKTTRVH